jgi:glycerate kinase
MRPRSIPASSARSRSRSRIPSRIRRILVAPDKFKGSLSANEASLALEHGALRAGDALGIGLTVERLPMADGGEGTLDAFVEGGWERVALEVHGPLGHPVPASFARSGETALVEMAAASGLGLVPRAARAPLRTTTYGTGELVRAALDAGARRIILALGGSATNDGGAGMLQALGMRFLDTAERELEPGGAALARLARIDAGGLDPRTRTVRFEVASDVDNPLLGPRGASAVFGPQKGAGAADVTLLDAALAQFAGVVAATCGVDRRAEPGTGAAGGLGFALRAFFDAPIRPGFELVAEVQGLDAALARADWCLTGEGSIDAQTASGKTVFGIARRAYAAGVPSIAFGGRVTADAETALAALGTTCMPIADAPLRLETALRRAAGLLGRAAERALRLALAPENA